MSHHIFNIARSNLTRGLSRGKLTLSNPILPLSHSLNHQQRRFLDLQEYQSKQILHEHGLQVQKFRVVTNDSQILETIFPTDNESSLVPLGRWSGFKEGVKDAEEYVIKAQILAGGRGKGHFKNSSSLGGVKLTKNPHEAVNMAKIMLNDKLITKQTTEEGVLVERVMIAEAVNLKKELYLAIVLDRSYDKGAILVTSPYGGMDIEDVAERGDNAIRKFTIPIDIELDLDTARKIVLMGMDLNTNEMDLVDQCADQILKLYSLFLKLDATQIEINPLGITDKDKVICVDAKIKFDESAKFRQNWLDELEKLNEKETDWRENQARKHNLNFIGLDGSIGCLVNGAGLAMATMDIIKLHGGQPANFLDVGGGASVEQVKAAFEIINSDENVKAIFVNIFGGIMRCDTVAQGIIEATKSLDLKVPIIVRLEGTRVEEAKKLIEDSQLNLKSIDDFDEAALMAVSLSETYAHRISFDKHKKIQE